VKLAIAAAVLVACGGDEDVTEQSCGDGVVDSDEECDDGNGGRGDGCFECVIEPEVCGNGILDSTEDCDDSNTVDGDGCSAICEKEITPRHITAEWQWINLMGMTTTPCPASVSMMALDITPAGGTTTVTDLFPCADGTGVSSTIAAGDYTVQLRALLSAGGVLATSFEQTIDLSAGDGTFSHGLLNDAGFFSLNWRLRGASSMGVFPCNQVGATTVRTTFTGPTTTTMSLPCADGEAAAPVFSPALLAGSYSVSLEVLDGALQPMGTSTPLMNQSVTAPDGVTPLSVIEISLPDF
jgi:cysteine-rich repeat protein